MQGVYFHCKYIKTYRVEEDMKFVNRLIERETLAGSFPVRRKSLLPRSISGEYPLTVIGTLNRPRASSEFFRKEEGWNHEHTRRPFVGMALLF